MKYTLYFVEHHSNIKLWESLGYKLTSVDSEGWGEFEHTQEFEADDDIDAKELVYELSEMSNNSSGVFNVYKNGKLAFTEE